MKRQVIFDQDEQQEGLCYDLERANREGLVEEITVTRDGFPEMGELRVRDDEFDALLGLTDLAVNLEPGHEVEIDLRITYRYDYGKIEEPVTQ